MVFRDKNSELCLLRKTKSSDLKDIKSVFKNLEKWLLIYKRSNLFLRPKKMVFLMTDKLDLFLYVLKKI